MRKIIFNKKILSYFILFLIGIIFGIIFIFIINKMDKLVVESEIKEYLQLILNNDLNIKEGFINSLIHNSLYISIIWISGFVFIFIPVVYFLIFYKGFMLGFLISIFLSIYKIKGILYFVIFTFPQEIINVFLILIMSFYSLNFSFSIIKSIVKNESVNLKRKFLNYFIIYFIIICISCISSILEIFLNYNLMRIVF